MDVRANLPEGIARHIVLDPKDTATFLGVNIGRLRGMWSERILPPPIRYSQRRYGWRIGDLIDWLNAGAPNEQKRMQADEYERMQADMERDIMGPEYD